jgi:ribonuclease HI
MAQKFYVVWSGRQTGVFTDWATTQQSVDKYPGARFKAFSTRAEAEHALRAGSRAFISRKAKTTQSSKPEDAPTPATETTQPFDVSIYCDGACEPNPGNAGSGVVVYREGVLSQLWYGLYNPKGTNNTAELNALHQALRMAEDEIKAGHSVEIRSDSMYSINCVCTWAPGWEKRGWKKAGGEIKNLEIIQLSYVIYQRIQADLQIAHVAAHVGTEGNELADRMAMYGAQSKVTELRLYEEEMDVAKLLKMRAG